MRGSLFSRSKNNGIILKKNIDREKVKSVIQY